MGSSKLRLRAVDRVGPLLCGLAGLLLVGALLIELDSTAAKVLMAASATAFVPGAFLTLAFVRRYMGPPR